MTTGPIAGPGIPTPAAPPQATRATQAPQTPDGIATSAAGEDAKYDANADGILTRDEYTSGKAGEREASALKLSDDLFAEFDRNNDGRISNREALRLRGEDLKDFRVLGGRRVGGLFGLLFGGNRTALTKQNADAAARRGINPETENLQKQIDGLTFDNKKLQADAAKPVQGGGGTSETPPATEPATPANPRQPEIDSLKGDAQKLFDEEQKLGDERRGLLADVNRNQAAYEALKLLPDDMLTEGDQTFLKEHETKSARVEALNQQIGDLNDQQAKINARIGALEEMGKLENENSTLFTQEQALGAERLPLLGEAAAEQGRFDRLSALPPEQRTEGDQAFMTAFTARQDKITELNNQIREANAQQERNAARIKELDESTKLPTP